MTNEADSGSRGLIVGITGGIACGKSTVARMLERDGVTMCEADAVAHATMTPDGPAYTDVVKRFGLSIVNADGAIDRGRLGERVFADAAEREALNAIVHPHVRHQWRLWAAQQRAKGCVAAIVVPLLFEVGADRDVDTVLCVVSSDDRIRQRLRDRGLTDEQASQRLTSQWPVEEKQKKSNYVIKNNGSLEELETETRRIWRTLLKKETSKHG